MTIKSIETILAELEADGRLRRFVPYFDVDEGEKRTLLLSPRIFDHVHRLRQTDKMNSYFSKFRAALAEYVRGDPVADDENTFKRVRPGTGRVWAFRITFNPHARLFGAFATSDIFVGLDVKLRRELDVQGGFELAESRVQNRWEALFGDLPRSGCWPLQYCINNVDL